MGMVFVHGVDLEAEFPGCLVAALPDVLDRVQTLMDGVAVPGMAGELLSGPGTVPAREFTIGLTMSDESPTAVRQMLTNIRAAVGAHLVQVRIADGLELAIDARCIGGRAVGDYAPLAAAGLSADLVFRAPHPYWRERSALSYIVTGTPTPLPQGNAPTAALWEIWPATATTVVDPVLTLYDHTGTAVRISTFTGLSIPVDDVLTIITAPDQMALVYSDAGVVAQNDALLPAGQLFPVAIDPHAHGNPYHQHWPMAAVTASAGTPICRVTYPRQFV